MCDEAEEKLSPRFGGRESHHQQRSARRPWQLHHFLHCVHTTPLRSQAHAAHRQANAPKRNSSRRHSAAGAHVNQTRGVDVEAASGRLNSNRAISAAAGLHRDDASSVNVNAGVRAGRLQRDGVTASARRQNVNAWPLYTSPSPRD